MPEILRNKTIGCTTQSKVKYGLISRIGKVWTQKLPKRNLPSDA